MVGLGGLQRLSTAIMYAKPNIRGNTILHATATTAGYSRKKARRFFLKRPPASLKKQLRALIGTSLPFEAIMNLSSVKL